MILNVCQYISEKSKIDVALIRIIFLGLTLFSGAGLLLYFVSFLVITLNKK